MFDPATKAHLLARAMIKDALAKSIRRQTLPEIEDVVFTIEIPKDISKGDLACNIAMSTARQFKLPPMKIAQAIVDQIDNRCDESIFESIVISTPGFINFSFSDRFYAETVCGILETDANYGRTNTGNNKKVMVEYVSANPTGPMHLGNARGGALGDCLAGILEVAGYDVFREFYVNDAGSQIEKFAKSLEARYLGIYDSSIVFPEDGYMGQDIIDHAKGFAAIYKDSFITKSSNDRKTALVEYALPLNLNRMKEDLLRYRIEYDIWFKESVLHNNKTVDKVVDILESKGVLYSKDDALWYRATDFGGDKDEVLVRSNGFYTYFAVDIAYHYNKFVERGFDTVINVWGADHHGHVARLKGAMDAIGLNGDKLQIVLNQMVTLMQDGMPVRMSKRTGKTITLTNLLDEVPIDAARFFFNLREPKSHLDFDLDLAAKQSSENPVYYVQYAYARICSILKGLAENGIDIKKAYTCDYTLLKTPEERALIRYLAYLPSEIIAAAKEFNPARITRYTVELATLFHKFYTNCRVKSDDESIMYPRIALSIATSTVLLNCLRILKISAPESM